MVQINTLYQTIQYKLIYNTSLYMIQFIHNTKQYMIQVDV